MTLNLNSVDFKPTYGPGLLIKSPHEVTLNLENGSVNDFKGSNGKNINATAGSFAGIEVEFEFEEECVSLDGVLSIIHAIEEDGKHEVTEVKFSTEYDEFYGEDPYSAIYLHKK